jgi:hypothetical protein
MMIGHQPQTLEAIDHAGRVLRDQSGDCGSGTHVEYLRQELASRLSLRHLSELHFEQDKNPEAESRVDFLLRRARESRGATKSRTKPVQVKQGYPPR